MAGRPQESSRTGPTYQLAEFVNHNWDTLVGRTNEDVASELGYRSANIISMWRTGRTRIPLEKLPDVSRLMKIDISQLLPMWFEQQWGDRTDVKVLQDRIISHIATEREAKALQAIRTACGMAGTEFSDDQIKAIAAVVSDPAILSDVLSKMPVSS